MRIPSFGEFFATLSLPPLLVNLPTIPLKPFSLQGSSKKLSFISHSIFSEIDFLEVPFVVYVFIFFSFFVNVFLGCRFVMKFSSLLSTVSHCKGHL